MSQRRILEFEIIANSRGFEAALNRINSGLGRTGQQTRGTTRELSLMDRQIQAIGTTARYALAGSLVFGITGAIQRLTDFQNQLGVVAGLAGTLSSGGTYTPPNQNFLSSVGDEAQLAANRVGIATDDVQSYMTRFYSTFSFQNPNSSRARRDMRDFVGEVTRLQALLGVEAGDPQQLAGGIAGFVNQIPGGKQHIGATTNRVANLISYLTAQTPNITGRDISRDIGRIGATMSQTGMTPEQVFAVWGQAGRAGGSSSVIGRGIAQLLGNMLHPTTPSQVQTYQQIGLPTDPATLRRMGAFNVLRRMMAASTTGPIRARNAFALNDENIDDPTAAIGAAGVSGVNLNRVYGLFSRQESARQFVNLLAQGGVQALNKYITTQNKAADANAVYARETAALRQRELARFTTARQNISLSLARGAAWPLEHIVAPPVIAASNFLAGHDRVRQGVDAAFAGLLLRSGIRRLRGGLFRGGGASGAIGAALTAEAAPNLLAGGEHPTGSRDNPLWVIIHPTSWAVGSPGGNQGFSSPVPGGGGRRIPPIIGAATKAALLRFGGPAAVAGLVLSTSGDQGGGSYGANTLLNNEHVGHDPRYTSMGALGAPLQAALRATGLHRAPNDIYVTGQANADLTIRLVDAQGRTIMVQEHNGVPVKIWSPNQGMPSKQGKPGTRRKR